MRFLRVLALSVLLSGVMSAAGIPEAFTDLHRQLQQSKASAFAGTDGWLFLASELRFLVQGPFWGEAAMKTSRVRKANAADPLPAIVHFARQLRDRNIKLLVVPVPPKIATYAGKALKEDAVQGSIEVPQLQQFHELLRGEGVDVLDLAPPFAREAGGGRGPVFCKTDSHWSGIGTVLAGEAIAQRIRAELPPPAARQEYDTSWKEIRIAGDLIPLLPPGTPGPGPETIGIRTVSISGSGAPVQPDENSPLLVMGDSHTLVFRDFLAERAGLVDQLAHELGFAPDLIGTRGSGATAVRISLYRRALKNPAYLAGKKVIVWCFAAREFTEADQGWVQQPVSK